MNRRALLALAVAVEAGAAAFVRVLRDEADRLEADPGAGDLVAFPFGLEANAARRLIASGELPARKVGRRWMALTSDVAALVRDVPRAPKTPRAVDAPAAAYSAHVATLRARRGRHAA